MTGLRVWAASDGRVGIENQVLGLAEAVARLTSAEVTTKRVRWRFGLGRLPTPLIPTGMAEDAEIAPPWPDVWIAAGRATLPLSLAMRRWSQGRTVVVQLQSPGYPPDRFDLVIPPRHDALEGPGVLPILGSPNRVTPGRLTEGLAAIVDRLEGLPPPRVVALIGGASKAHRLPTDHAAALAEDIARAVAQAGGSLLMTFSRRTPAAARAVMRKRLAALPGWVWDGEGANPYFGFLAAADVVLVTADSTNMATDAATAGAPILVLPLPGGAPKFDRLHAELEAHGATRPFAGRLDSWTYPPLRETDRAAAAVLAAWRTRGVRSPATAR